MFFCAVLHKVTRLKKCFRGKKETGMESHHEKNSNSHKSVLSRGIALLYSKMNNKENVFLLVEPKKVLLFWLCKITAALSKQK